MQISQLKDFVMNMLSPGIISELAEKLGDEPQQVVNAAEAGLPVLLNGILQKSTTVDGLAKVLHEAREMQSAGVLSHASEIFSGGGQWAHKGAALMTSLFGDQENQVQRALADNTGLKSSSVQSVLRMLAPLVLGFIGKQVFDNKADNKGFASMLSGLIPSMAGLLPVGLSFNGLGLKSPDELKHGLDAVSYNLSSSQVSSNTPSHTKEEKEKTGMGWLLPLLLGLGIIAAIWYFMNRNGNEKKEETTVAPAVLDTLPASTVSQTPLTLPDGYTLPFSKGTMEFKLFEFINDATRPAGKDIWFDFDDINFDLASDKISETSNIQLENVARIVKAYPKVKVKVGGYTDRSGDSTSNMVLSQKRAEAIVNALKRFGVPESQLMGAEGYGSQFATMPATATEEERRIDRRMAISVREK